MNETSKKVSPGDLRALATSGHLPAATLERLLKSMGALPGPAQWRELFHWFSLALGAGLVVIGVIFFFAANWPELHKFHKLALLAGILSATTIGAVVTGLSRPSGRILLMAAAVLVGGLLALFGQIYQTGADAWELFYGWSLLIIPWTLIARFRPLFFFLGCLVLTTLGLYFDQELARVDTLFMLVSFLTLGALVMLTLTIGDEVVAAWNSETKSPRYNSGWLARASVCITLALLFFAAMASVDSSDGFKSADAGAILLARFLYLFTGVGVFFYWTRFVRDLLPLAIWSLGAIIWITFYFGLRMDGIGTFPLLALLLIGMTTAAVQGLRYLQRQWAGETTGESA